MVRSISCKQTVGLLSHYVFQPRPIACYSSIQFIVNFLQAVSLLEQCSWKRAGKQSYRCIRGEHAGLIGDESWRWPHQEAMLCRPILDSLYEVRLLFNWKLGWI